MYEQPRPYKRQYRYKPKEETIKGADYVKVMLFTFVLTALLLGLELMM